MKCKSFVCAPLLASALLASPVFAADAPVSSDTRVSLNTSYFTKKFDKPGSRFELTGWTMTLNVSQRLSDAWSVGGFVAATHANAKVETDTGQKDVRGLTPGGYAIWNNGRGLVVDGTASYGRNALDNSRVNGGRNVFYQSHTRQFATSAGVSQYFPITQTLLASVGARYARFFQAERGYTDPVGGNVPGQNENWGMGTVRGGLTYLYGDLTPFVGVDANRANREIIAGSGSRDFLGYEAGTGYQLTPSTGLNVVYSGTTGIRYLTDRRYSIGLSHKF